MTVLTVVQSASLRIGVTRPTVLFAGTTRELLELQNAVNDAAKMIAFDSGHDWTALKALGTFTGDGTSLAFDLPPDYRRMLKKTQMWPSSSPSSPLTHVIDSDKWLGTQVQNFSPVLGMWTLIGTQAHIRIGGATGALGSGDTVQFYYVTNKVAQDSGGTAKTEFTADDDTFKLDDRLLTLALIYKWKQAKQQDYAEAMSDYENALFERIGADKGPSIIAVGRPRVPANVGLAYPWPLGS
jgi:hypothetical protein